MLLTNMINNFSTTFQGYMKNSAQLLQEIQQQAEKEQLPKEQLKKIIKDALKQRGLADSTIRRILPAELKNQNMVRTQKPKPLVTRWDVDCDIKKYLPSFQKAYDEGKKVYITHDNKRVVDVGTYE